jgi:hypothetical protein
MHKIELRQKPSLIVSPVFDLVINEQAVGSVYLYMSKQDFVMSVFNEINKTLNKEEE